MVTLHDRHPAVGAVLLRHHTEYMNSFAPLRFAPSFFATYNAGQTAGDQRSPRFGPRLHQLPQVDLPLLWLLALRYTIFVQIRIA
jgi:hypothetical protein